MNTIDNVGATPCVARGQGNRISRRAFVFSLVASALFKLPQQAFASITPVKPFSFAFISDVHLTHGVADTFLQFAESQLFLQDAVKAINALNVDFVVFGGDMVETPGKDEENWNLFIDCLQNLNPPWDFVLGEADVSGPSAVDKMRQYGPDWKGRGYENNAPYWSKSPEHNVHLIALDTSKPNSKAGFVSKDQLEWLRKDLEQNKTKFTIVFSHHPVLTPSPYDGSGPFADYAIVNGDEVREILGGSPYVRLAISGHVPVSKVQKEGTIYYVSCPSLVAYPCAFKVFRVNADEIKMETHQISYKALVKKAEKALLDSTFAFSYNRANPKEFVSLCQGGHEDVNAILPLYGGMTVQPYHLEKDKKGKKEKKKK